VSVDALAPASADSRRADAPPGHGTLAVAGRGVHVAVLVAWRIVPAACVALALRLTGRRAHAGRYLSRRVVAVVQELGPVFVKVGQILGTRRDVLPAPLCDELRRLHADVAPMTPAAARSAFADLYDDAVFRELDDVPEASGSIACVYRGVLDDGREVAVKLRRPGIEQTISRDLALFTRTMRAAGRLRAFRGVPLELLAAEVAAAVRGQIDFAAEAAALARLREMLAVVPRMWIPAVEPELCRDGAIVMEYIPELDRRTVERLTPSAASRFASSALTAVYEMIFVEGFVHCDLHPGNLYVTSSGEVVILDAGFTVQLSDRLRRLFAEFFLNMSLGRGRRCAEIVVKSASAVAPDADLDAFSDGLADLVERNARVAARDFSLIAFAAEMFDLQRRFGLMAATELVFPLLSLLVVEGTVRALDPGLDFQEVARPVLTRGVFQARRPA